MKLIGLNHLTISVENVESSFNFYNNILGFIPRAKWNQGAYLSLGDLWLCLSLDEVSIGSDYTHYCFSISEDNIDEFHQKIKLMNIREWKSNQSEGKSIYFLDPDGHKLEVHVGNLSTRLESCKKKPYEGMVFFDE
jgi:catechol 2,3-dioxygenase-like lactoylglutathione lyase family enzyme